MLSLVGIFTCVERDLTEPRIAVLMACHNRRDITLRCLRALHEQDAGVAIMIFLVDDGSVDGTGDAVRERFPTVRVIDGTGDLYWVGAMRRAFAAAQDESWTHLLWLNDDVELAPSALRTLLEVSDVASTPERPVIAVGAVCDPVTGATTYSGLERSTAARPLRFSTVEPVDRPVPCETFHGNVVLIPRAAVDRIGNLDAAFTHTLADLDYGLRARRLGLASWVAPGYVGTCPGNPAKGEWNDRRRGLRERFALATSVKALPPREWGLFARRYAGVAWSIYWVSPYVRIVTSWATRPRGATVTDSR